VLVELENEHEWAWSAIAELMHNSSDAHASCVRIALVPDGAVPDSKVLTVEDNGDGIDHQTMQVMLTVSTIRMYTQNDCFPT
jgi:DNA mismatch repair ATPase MutL